MLLELLRRGIHPLEFLAFGLLDPLKIVALVFGLRVLGAPVELPQVIVTLFPTRILHWGHRSNTANSPDLLDLLDFRGLGTYSDSFLDGLSPFS